MFKSSHTDDRIELAPESIVRTIIFVFLLLACSAAQAQPRQLLVPGGIAIIDLDGNNSSGFEFRGKPVLVTQIDGIPSAIIGLPLNLKPGEHFIEKRSDNQVYKKYFTIVDKEYSTQHITITDKRKVNPYASDMDRILAEKKRKQKARIHYSKDGADVNFVLPVSGIRTGSYGRRRVFNGQPRRPHSGMDIAAETGTPIVTPSAGTVIEMGDFFFSGNLIYIDHGQGLISMFAHLSEINVSPGERVEKGQSVGKLGATGRVTGPHLHWSLGLNGTWIDPSLFLSPEND